MWAKYVEGKWIYGDGDISLHFRTHFREIVHVVGDVSSRNEDEWVYANPHPNSWELVLGLDLGEINHAAVIIDRTIIDGVLCFTVIDEILYRKKEVSIRDFTMELVEMIEEHEEMAGHPFMTERAWSDKNSIDTYSATADTYPYLQVYNASNERIMLRALPKAKTKGAVRVRVELVKQLLHYGRLKVSAHCIHTIEMFKKLPKGKVDYVPTEHPCKHIFDALSYALFMECAEELELGPKAMGTRSTSRQAAISVQVA
jgi:hypothetical protein